MVAKGLLPALTNRQESCHGQVLGGPTAQTYLGCRFPADDAYRALIRRALPAHGRILDEETSAAPGEPRRGCGGALAAEVPGMA